MNDSIAKKNKLITYIILAAELMFCIILVLVLVFKEQTIIDCSTASGTSIPINGYELELPRGSYDIDIVYDASGDAVNVQPYAYTAYGKTYGESVKLLEKRFVKSFEYYLYENTERFGLQINEGTNGNLNIVTVTIRRNSKMDRAFGCTVLFFMILIDAILYLVQKKRIWEKLSEEQRNVCIGLIFVFVLSIMPLYTNYFMEDQHDQLTHMKRIEGIAEGLKMGQFPVRMQPVWMHDYGYPVSVMYGDLFLYIPAVLRIIGYSIMNCYKIYIAIVSAATILITYFCVKKMCNSLYLGLIASALYTLSAYRITNVYVRSAAGEFTAMAFFPLVFYALGCIFHSEAGRDKKERFRFALCLIISYTAILQSHTLSFEMIILFTLIFCLSFGKKFLKNLFFLVNTAVITVLVNLSFLVPFVDYMFSHEMGWENYDILTVQQHGIFPAQLLQTFSFGGSYSQSVASGIQSEMPLTIGLAMVLAFLVFVWQFAVYGRRMWPESAQRIYGVMQRRIAIFMALAVYMSCWFFPWKWPARIPLLGKYLVPFQFPWRFLVFATVFGMFLAVCVIKNMERLGQKRLKSIVITLFIACTIINAVSLYDRMLVRCKAVTIDSVEYFDPLDVQRGEYMLKGASAATSVDTNFILSDGLNLISEEREHYHIRAEVDNSTSTSKDLIAPTFAYKGFVARDSSTGNELLTYTDASTMRLVVVLPAGYKGTVEINFVVPFYWRIAELVSLLTCIALIVYILYRKKNGYSDNSNKTNSAGKLLRRTGKSGRKKLVKING